MIHKLEADSIQLQFNNRPILSDIYIKTETGRITGFLGRNGAGKSCLMKIVYGTLSCEKSVRFDGVFEPCAYKKPDLILYLPQHAFIPKILTLSRIFNDFYLDFEMFIQLFPEYANKYNQEIGRLSGGGYRTIELYCILKSKTSFVILDEPFSHISPIQIEQIKQIIISEKENKGILISDHMYKHVIDICDDFYILANGKTHLTKNLSDIERLGYARL